MPLTHRAWWAIWTLNYDLNAAGEERKLNLNELRSKWIGPFVIVRVFPRGAVEIKDPTNDQVYKVNGHRLKHFFEMPSEEDVECLLLHVPLSLE